MKKIQIFVALFVMLGLISLMNALILENLGSQGKGRIDPSQLQVGGPESLTEEPEQVVAREVKHYELVPEDPATYGIIAMKSSKVPQHQLEWDLHMDRMINDSGILETENGQQALAKMNTSPSRFEETITQVDQEIQAFEENVRQDPFDEKANRRLQTLYKLKAISKALQGRAAGLSEEEYQAAIKEAQQP